MSDHLFRLLERLQKLDDQLRRAQRQRKDRQEIARLTLMKSALRHRLARLSARSAFIRAMPAY